MAALNPNAPLYVSLVHNYGLHLPVYSFNYFHEYPLYPSNKSWWLSRVTYLQHPPLPPPPPPPTRCQYYQHVNEMQEKDARTVNVNVINVKSKEIKAKGKRSRQSKGTKVKAAAAAAKEPEKDIQEAGVLLSKKTTTLMIRNLPNKFDQEKVLDLLDEHCKKANEKVQQNDNGVSEFDFLYLPIDFSTGCNYGYAFVNLTAPAAAQRLYDDMHGKSWKDFGCPKVCQVTPARIQGLGALLGHFRDSVFRCEKGEYRPVYFTPSRNGLRSTNKHHIGRHIPC